MLALSRRFRPIKNGEYFQEWGRVEIKVDEITNTFADHKKMNIVFVLYVLAVFIDAQKI